jgi:tripartite-type tricarboxylate transporter receptor subunit TctC
MHRLEIHLVKRRREHDITKSSRRRAKPKASLFLFAALLFAWTSNLDAQTPYYQGKTIRIVVGSTTGGGYDLWARLLAPYYSKHIPGNPEIIVQNMPGAGSLVAANHVYNLAKVDGLTLGAILPALYFDQLVGRKEVQFDWLKFTWIGSPEQNEPLHYMRADSPYQTVEDIRKAKEPPRCGSSGTGTTGHYIPRLLEETLGLKHTIVGGYQGGTEIDLAVERGEVHCWSPLIATFFGREPYISWHKKGFVRVLVQMGRKRDPRLENVPTIYELMDQYKTTEAGKRLARVVLTAATLGRPLVAPPALAPERVKLLRHAYVDTLKDPELLAEVKKRRWELAPLTGEELEEMARDVMSQPQNVIDRMKWVLGRE